MTVDRQPPAEPGTTSVSKRVAVDAIAPIHSCGGMLDTTQRDQLKPLLRTMQIIVGALAFGVVNFLVVALWIVLNGNDPAVDPPRLTYAAIGAAIIAFLASFVVPTFLAGPLRRQASTVRATTGESGNVRQDAAVYQSLLIIRCAILEGAAFFCLVSYMVERHIAAPVAATLLLLTIAIQFPTMSRLESWIECERLTAEQMGHLGQ